jgi:hypothetical protein
MAHLDCDQVVMLTVDWDGSAMTTFSAHVAKWLTTEMPRRWRKMAREMAVGHRPRLIVIDATSIGAGVVDWAAPARLPVLM